jgi:hypothetical protein
MAAGQGFKTFNTGDVLTAADVNGYLMQGVLVFASTAARDAAITSPQEGQFAYTKDTNGLWYYDGAAWVASGATGDIEGVTAGIGISGGGTSGTVTVTNSMATAIDAKGDLVVGTGADTFSRIAVGANDTVLTADSTTATGLKWASAAGGSMTLLSTTTLSGASVTVSSISQSYKNLYMEWQNVTQAADGTFDIQPNGINGGFWSSALATGQTGGFNYTDNVIKLLNNVQSLAGSSANAGSVTIFNYASTTAGKTFNYQTNFFTDGSVTRSVTGGGGGNSNTAISSIKFNSTTGTTFSGGTLRIYGVN